MKVTKKRARLIISVPIKDARPSASGKTLVVASSRGVRKTQVEVDGRTVCVCVNAFCYLDAQIDGEEAGKKEGR